MISNVMYTEIFHVLQRKLVMRGKRSDGLEMCCHLGIKRCTLLQIQLCGVSRNQVAFCRCAYITKTVLYICPKVEVSAFVGYREQYSGYVGGY